MGWPRPHCLFWGVWTMFCVKNYVQVSSQASRSRQGLGEPPHQLLLLPQVELIRTPTPSQTPIHLLIYLPSSQMSASPGSRHPLGALCPCHPRPRWETHPLPPRVPDRRVCLGSLGPGWGNINKRASPSSSARFCGSGSCCCWRRQRERSGGWVALDPTPPLPPVLEEP